MHLYYQIRFTFLPLLLTLKYYSSIEMKKILFLLLTALLFSCSTNNAPDLILINGKVWTGEDETTFAEAIAVKGNMIVAVGKTSDIEALANSNTKVIDLQGKLVTCWI